MRQEQEEVEDEFIELKSEKEVFSEISKLKKKLTSIFKKSDNFWVDGIEHIHYPCNANVYNVKIVEKRVTSEEDDLFDVKEKEINILSNKYFIEMTLIDRIIKEGDPENLKEKQNKFVFIEEKDHPINAHINYSMIEILKIVKNINKEIPPKCPCCDKYCFDLTVEAMAQGLDECH